MTTYGPYTPVRSAGNFLFISGQIGIDPTTKTAAPDIAEQTKQVLRNMTRALEANGAGLNDVIKTTVFLTNMDDFAAMNVVYERYFEAPRPARSTISVRELPRVGGDTALLVEIEAVVYREQA
ncbi:MAG: reactive intermediate/imine deaminase [Candidatus Saccharibacteria bacterium]|jgi:2-iminobutanoate/2-iminopropanoate deaminase|nr:reactive intermediate/imine deaminase [Candidatus Saccharibacteria bacterium]